MTMKVMGDHNISQMTPLLVAAFTKRFFFQHGLWMEKLGSLNFKKWGSSGSRGG